MKRGICLEQRKISVITTVYKTYPYLRRCVASITAQTYKNLEIILVDDGSPDESGALCDELAKSDERIKAVHIENSGPAHARNTALDIVTGDYVAFVDSDDYIDNDMLSSLVALLEENDCDMAACSFKPCVDGGDIPSRAFSEKTEVFSAEEALCSLFRKGGMDFSACTKLFRAELFKKQRFTDGILMEDKDITYRIISDCKKVVYRDTPKYHYYMSENSIMRSAFSEKKLAAFEINERMERFFNTGKYPKAKKAFRCYGVKLGIIEISQMTHFGFDGYEYYEKSVKLLRKGFWQSLFSSVVDKRYSAAALIIIIRRFFGGKRVWSGKFMKRIAEKIYAAFGK